MARTDVQKAREAVWVDCTHEGFEDERHLILPASREALQYVSDKSMVNEFRNGQIVRESDNNVFTAQWLKKHWLDWEGVEIVHADGRLEAPAKCTPANQAILQALRPQSFLLWLQEAARTLAAKASEEREAQRDSFREPAEAPAGLSGAEL